MLNYYLKLSWLSLRQTPVISALMVLVIAIGIGVSMTTLTVYHLKNINPMAHKNERLLTVQLQTKGEASDAALPEQLTYQDVMQLRQSDIPVRQAAMYRTGFTVQPVNPEIKPFIERARVTDSAFFTLFDVEFIHGGPWDKQLDEIGDNVTVITADFNDKLFGGQDGSVNSVGRTIDLNGVQYTVVGVIRDYDPAPKFYDLNNGAFDSGDDIHIPFSLTPVHHYPSWGSTVSWKSEKISTPLQWLQSEIFWLQFWVEIDGPQMQAQYQDYLNAHIVQQREIGRFSRADAGAVLSNVRQWLDSKEVVGSDSRVLVGLSFMFLVVCVVNTVGLLLARFLRRAPQVGVRRALGASQLEVFKQHLVEVALVGFCGGLLGLLFTFLGLSGLRSVFSNFERFSQIDLTMTLAVFVIAIVSSLLAGVYPAYRICQTNPATLLKTQ